ncbi:50S ribosomal protein L10 [bacterium]|nr:50S ribosomal protein L10 [bacterium]
MPSERKVRQLERLKQFLEESKGIIFTDHTGTSVNDLTRFRKELAKVNASFHIVKNNLLKLAWKEVKNEEIDETLLTGPTSVLLTGNDISAGARILKNYIKEMQKPVPKVIYFGRNFYPDDKLDFFSSLPTESELRAQLVGRLQTPLLGLVFVLSGVMRNLVSVLNQIKEKNNKPCKEE